MSTLSSANVTDVNLVLKERTHMRLCLNMLIFMHNLGNWLIIRIINISNKPSAAFGKITGACLGDCSWGNFLGRIFHRAICR